MGQAEYQPMALTIQKRHADLMRVGLEQSLDCEAQPTRFDIYFDFLPGSREVMKELQSFAIAKPAQIESLRNRFAAARHAMMGEIYFTLATGGLTLFNASAVRTIGCDIDVMLAMTNEYGVSSDRIQALNREFESTRIAFLNKPADPVMSTGLMDLQRQQTADVYVPAWEAIGKEAAARGIQAKKKTRDALGLGFELSSEKGLSRQLLSFAGRLGAGYNFDGLQSYMTWFAAIMKSNFPQQFAHLAWSDLNVMEAHYGLSSMILELDQTGVKFRLVQNPNHHRQGLFTEDQPTVELSPFYQPLHLQIESNSHFTPVLTSYVAALTASFETIELPALNGKPGTLVCCPRITKTHLGELGQQETLEF